MSVFHNGVTYRAADAHAHIYPGKIAEKATGSVGEFYHIPMQNVGLPHILAQRGEEAGIDRFLVCSVATKVEQVRSINQFIQEKCQKYPQFIGLAAWHQDVADIQREMDDIQRRGCGASSSTRISSGSTSTTSACSPSMRKPTAGACPSCSTPGIAARISPPPAV